MTSGPRQMAAGDWHQVLIQFTGWRDAEQIAAARLRPWLIQARRAGVIGEWWFLRKYPCWRFRFLPRPCPPAVTVAIGDIMNELTGAGLVSTWRAGIYEPETFAFGGPRGIAVAHRLFHHDSLGFLDYVGQADPDAARPLTIGRREMSVLLCTTLLREAGQDCYEQGDVWHRVAQMRPLQPGDGSVPSPDRLATALRRLLAASPAQSDSALAFAGPWLAGFSEAGRAIGAARQAGELERGTRSILAHLVIFHWNRLGLTAQTQAIISRALRDTIMGTDET